MKGMIFFALVAGAFAGCDGTGKVTLNPFATAEPTPVPVTPTPKVAAKPTPKPGDWMFKNYRPALDPKKK